MDIYPGDKVLLKSLDHLIIEFGQNSKGRPQIPYGCHPNMLDYFGRVCNVDEVVDDGERLFIEGSGFNYHISLVLDVYSRHKEADTL